ncbi:sensor histidine kinase [Parachryseolinea silvisoli]|uniref:sensor histidine kinase n=1 Tax=Parachryseolinea silvisoli TaxID=2873601 RepID=UPI002265DA64|nr:HAMP domain-containing sensor histidine kinase [Parachryseolinea silvisoli]MCD9016621.1 HAMP domain-containing histidine kinase [Parachryseolinea silvisoli]
MNNKHLGRIILFGTCVLACLLILQVYWFRKAFDVAEKQFDHSVQVALKRVADSVARNPEVKKLSSNFYFVVTSSQLDSELLDDQLQKEFLVRSLNLDYELGVYNAHDDTLVYGNYISATQPTSAPEDTAREASTDEKNFAVYFPKKNSFVAAQLDIWIFSTLALLLMMGFFAYAIYSLLRERKFAALKNDFINNMTHEFKTPVTNVRIAGEILKKKIPEPDNLHVYVDILLKENESLRQKIDQVLLGASVDYVRRPTLEVVHVHQLIRECVEAFQLKVQERNGSLIVELHAERNTAILADRELLAQAISNLIDNAEKYSRQRPNILIRTSDCREGIAIHIVDEGIGIDRSMRTKVFEKFFRVRSGDVHDVKGFGLGLSFVKSVIRSHRGKVNLLSELHKGTAVQIILPAA